MNKKIKLSFFAFALVVLAGSFTSCEKEQKIADTSNSEELKAINKQYVNNVVLPTYASLTDETIKLYEALKTLKGSKTDANVKAAADLWKSSRVFWEESEAFLFGPVDQLGVDPHIDTWPMSVSAFNDQVSQENFINSINNEDGDKAISVVNNDDGVLGFHCIEYILFRDGAVRKASAINENELIYAVAAAGDLRNQCSLIELGWLGESISAEKLGYAKRSNNYDALNSGTNEDGDKVIANFAKVMTETPNATMTSALLSTEEILDGCFTIADEVATAKIGKPYNGASDEDKNYIESQFSHNSIVDFAGNIRSIENAYLGGLPGKRGKSVSEYVKSKDSSLDTQIKASITDVIAKIDAIKNFEINAQENAQVKAAMEACIELGELLEDAKVAIRD